MFDLQKFVNYLAVVALGETNRHPDAGLFGYATLSKLETMYHRIGVPLGLSAEFRWDYSIAAADWLTANTRPTEEGGLPSGIELLVSSLCERAKRLGYLDTAIQKFNDRVADGRMVIASDEEDAIHFHYGCLWDPNRPQCARADASLRELERTLRFIISSAMESKYGDAWPSFCGLSADRVETWISRQKERPGAALINYSDFYDLRKILHKQWDVFKGTFQHWKRTEVFLEELEGFRNDLKHHRDITEDQALLCLAMATDLLARCRWSLTTRQ